ncbi:MAG: hemagluttinin repeat-domain-containing protein [Linnemannia elongata]|nr:MAG: hemagluttinin repeat-domain-containing protein [Linnemannia elongata]
MLIKEYRITNNCTNAEYQLIAGGRITGDLSNLRNLEAEGARTVQEAGSSQYSTPRYRGRWKNYHTRDWHHPIPYTPADEIHTITVPVTKVLEHTQSTRSGAQIPALSRNLEEVSIPTPSDIPGHPGTMMRTQMPAITLPNHTLFRHNPKPDSLTLIETDPHLTRSHKKLDAEYMLKRMAQNPAVVQKRLGDGFYEQRLVGEQINQLTGRRFLHHHTNDEVQYRALMEQGLHFADQLKLHPGIALSAAQMAQLTSDIVWPVQREVALADGAVQKVNVDAEEIKNLGGKITGGETILHARTDLDNHGGALTGDTHLAVRADRDLNLLSTTQQGAKTTGASHFSRTHLDRVASLTSHGSLSASAGRDATFTAAEINNTSPDNQTTLTAGHNLNLGALTVGYQENMVGDANNFLKQGLSDEIGSTIQTVGNLQLAAGHNFTAKAANLTSHSSSSATRDTINQTQASGSLLSGNTVKIKSGQNLTVHGSDVVANQQVSLAAEGDIHLTAAQNTASHSHQSQQQKSGLLNGGGVGIMIGSQTQHDQAGEREITHTDSTIASLTGDVTIVSGKDTQLKASGVYAGRDLNVTGQNITLDNVHDVLAHSERHTFKQSGLSVGLGGEIVEKAKAIYHHLDRASKVKDPRLKAVKQMQAVYALDQLSSAAVTGSASGTQGAAGGKSVRLELSIGSSQSEHEAHTIQTTARGSNLVANRRVNIMATGDGHAKSGDLTVKGSQIKGKEVNLAARHDLVFESVANTGHQQSKQNSSGFTAGVGVSLGQQSGLALFASGQVANGHADGKSAQYANSSVIATDTLTLTSGRDATLTGAQLSGQKIKAEIGRNLTLTSQQDSDAYHQGQTNLSAGLSGVLGAGGYEARSSGFSASYGGAASAKQNIVANSLANVPSGLGLTGTQGAASSTTQAAISPARIEVRRDQKTGQDSTQGLKRDTQNAHQTLQKIFDLQEVQEKIELGREAANLGMQVSGDLANKLVAQNPDSKLWGEGQLGRIGLHAAVAGLGAKMAGGNVGGAIAGTVAGDLVSSKVSARRLSITEEQANEVLATQANLQVQSGSPGTWNEKASTFLGQAHGMLPEEGNSGPGYMFYAVPNQKANPNMYAGYYGNKTELNIPASNDIIASVDRESLLREKYTKATLGAAATAAGKSIVADALPPNPSTKLLTESQVHKLGISSEMVQPATMPAAGVTDSLLKQVASRNVKTYGPREMGPLGNPNEPRSVAATFRSGTDYGGEARAGGDFWSPIPSKGVLQSKMDSAVLSEWGITYYEGLLHLKLAKLERALLSMVGGWGLW